MERMPSPSLTVKVSYQSSPDVDVTTRKPVCASGRSCLPKLAPFLIVIALVPVFVLYFGEGTMAVPNASVRLPHTIPTGDNPLNLPPNPKIYTTSPGGSFSSISSTQDHTTTHNTSPLSLVLAQRSTATTAGSPPTLASSSMGGPNCPTVHVVPSEDSGSLAVWLGLHSLLPNLCLNVHVNLYAHSSLVDQLRHAVATWGLPGSPRVEVWPLSAFSDSADSASDSGRLFVLQGKGPVPGLDLPDSWARDGTVRVLQPISDQAGGHPTEGPEAGHEGGPSRSLTSGAPREGVFDVARTAVVAVPTGVRVPVDSCRDGFVTPGDVIRCVEDATWRMGHVSEGRVLLDVVTKPTACLGRSCWDGLLATAMDRDGRCGLKKPIEGEEHDKFECDWVTEHSSLPHTELPFALGFYVDAAGTSTVTYATQMTLDRLYRLEEGARRWEGPISVAVYVTVEEALSLAEEVEAFSTLRGRRDVMYHLVGSCGPMYPINLMRNAAMKFAVTPYVLLADVDVVPTHDMHAQLEAAGSSLATDHKTLLVVPVVEFPRKTKNGLGHRRPPLTKDELRPLFANGSVIEFEEEISQVAYKPTDIGRYLESSEDYIVNYTVYYEPYMVVDRLKTPFFDTSFIGYGFDKSSLHANLHLENFRFKVLTNCGFLFHLDNPRIPRVKSWRPNKIENFCNYMHFKKLFKGTKAWVRKKNGQRRPKDTGPRKKSASFFRSD